MQRKARPKHTVAGDHWNDTGKTTTNCRLPSCQSEVFLELPPTWSTPAQTIVKRSIYFRARYLQQVLEKHQATAGALEPSYVARLSSLLHKHVTIPGHYDFTLPECVAAGELQPLRNLAHWQEQLAKFS